MRFAKALLLTPFLFLATPAQAEDMRYCDYGKQLADQRQHNEAVRYFNHCIQHGGLGQKQLVGALLKRGKSLAIMQQLDFAIRDFSAAIQYAPNMAAAYHNRAVAYAKAGQMTQALSDFNTSIQISPNEPSSYLGRAVVYKSQGQEELAAADAARAKQLAQGG